MKNNLTIIYTTILFIIYFLIFKIINIPFNSMLYINFIVMILAYYFSKNLQFKEKIKYNTLYINGVFFLLFIFLYKENHVFNGFLIFSIMQVILFKIFKKISCSIEDRYDENILNLRNFVKLSIDSISIVIAMVITLLFKYEVEWYNYFDTQYLITYLGLFLIGYIYTDFDKKSWSFTNIIDVCNILAINIGTAIIFFGIELITRSIYLSPILILLVFIISISIQLFGRYCFRLRRYLKSAASNCGERKRALIYGAGEAGMVLARESLTNKNFPYDIVGFIDDNSQKIGTQIYKVKVLGNGDTINKIIKNESVDEILLALPSLKGQEIKQILEKMEGKVSKIKIKTIPSIAEVVETESLASQLRSVKIEDLLGRDEISINDNSIRNLIEGRVIFVTGGAGSIGSELSRQIAKYNPQNLVIIDINENDIYFLELELKRRYPNLNFVSEICNIREKEKLDFLFNKYKPNIVFHAAAHKHVPLMEHNPEEAIKNNIFGTKDVAECCEEYGVQRMVLISTDKAVNPTNLMGASKRACELVIEHMNKIAKNTKFMAVRFGNVLGSHGSVIPIFKQLIEEGKNLTVTHKEITRYFMTIPEAAQLVIEAGAIGKGGEIFILDMGKPVKIYELAKTMIKLSNANVGIDIVGLRPGEKLYEELLYDTNNAIKTENKKIFITKIEGGLDISEFYDKLEDITHNPDVNKIKEIMKEVVVSYKEAKYE